MGILILTNIKGQIISKGHFGVFNSSKKRKHLKSGQLKKIKALSYINYGSLGARAEICQIFSLVKEFILKLSDLYFEAAFFRQKQVLLH